MTWGVFNDEGCVEADLPDKASAQQAAARHRADGDQWAVAKEVCSDHEEQEAFACEECAAEEEADNLAAEADDDPDEEDAA